MKLPMFLALFFASVSFATIATSEQNLPSADDLTDGIRAFLCDVEEVGSDLPVIFVREEDQWRLSGFNYDQIAKISNGFRLKDDNHESSLGLLLQETDGWKLYFLDENGQSSSECQPMESFTRDLVSAIAPKLLKNSSNALSADKAETLNSEIETLKRKNEGLIQNSRMWQEKIKSLEKQLEEQ